ncbi:MAG: sulfatase family protein [Pirellulales bacterium]
MFRTALLIAATLLVLPVVQAADEPKRPNILFAIADDWSFGHAGAYGCGWTNTPAFDRVAKEGLLFNRAYTPNAKCAPSRAIILTGRNSWQLEEAGNHMAFFPAKFKSYVEELSDQGYSVGYTGKGWGPGFANDVNGKPRKITGQSFAQLKAKPPTRGISSNDYSGNFKQFVEKSSKDKPWCFWYGTTEPHRGYVYGSGIKKGGKKLSDIKHVPVFWPDNEVIRNDMLDYAYEVEHYDRHLGKIIEALEASGQLENTLIVATADHGMPFPRCKGQAYDYSNHIPLAIRWGKGIKNPGRVIEDYVNFTDVAPTFLEVAGVDQKDVGMQPLTGRSWTPFFNSTKSGQVFVDRDHVLIGKERHDTGRPNDWGYPIRGIVKDNMLYIKNFEVNRWPGGNPETGYLNCDGSPTKTEILNLRRSGTQLSFWNQAFGKRIEEELYNIKKDPDCVNNLAADRKYTTLKNSLIYQMETELKSQSDPRMFGKGEVFDLYRYSGDSTRNFHGRYTSGEKVNAGWVNKSDFEGGPLD